MNPSTFQELLDICRELIEFINPNGMAGPPPADWSEKDQRFIEKAQLLIFAAEHKPRNPDWSAWRYE